MIYRRAAIIGAIALTAAGCFQDYQQGDPLSLTKIVLWLGLGALIGVGVGKITARQIRNKNRDNSL